MAIHDDATIIGNLRETVRLQGEELAELRRLVGTFGPTGGPGLAKCEMLLAVIECREHNRKQKGTT